MAAGATHNVYGATAAGTEIKNLATVSYEDAAGNSYTAQSNEAVVTVAQVYSATINSTDTVLSAAAGQPVDISYTLQNTGNGADNYLISAFDGIVGGDQIDADSITIYEDTNNNGQADSGEPVINALTLAADEVKSIIVRVDVPNNAVINDGLGITLLAVAEEGTGSAVPGAVTDLTASKGPDGSDDTVESLITVTGDAVVVATKSSTHDAANNTITYTITVKNNGNTDAATVEILDAIPADTNFVGGSITTSGLLLSNADAMPAFGNIDENQYGIDYDGDGSTTNNSVPGVSALDAVLPANATITITYTVDYDPVLVAGGTVVSNVAYVAADVDNNTGTPALVVPTNQVNDTLNDLLLVSISDTGEGTGGDGLNDGQDDDGLNNIQLVDVASAGDAVIFKHLVSNNGNTEDVLELSIANVSFPPGTVFTFWNEDQTVQLSDTNGANGVDVGVMASLEQKTISVVAQLPAGFDGPGNYDATVTVTSVTDPTVSNTVTDRLGGITPSTIDIHNSATGVAGVDDDPIGAAPYAAVNTTDTDVNTTVNILLFIDNDDDGDNSYLLTAGSVYNAGTDTVDGLPVGWTVEFFEADGAGLPTGNAFTTTPVIPGKTLNYEIVAVVTVPADQNKAVDSLQLDNDADTIVDFLDGNGDGDGDYPIFFQISSTNTGASDVTLEAIDVNSVITASLTPNGSNQIDPGGTETYANTLTNDGNATETYALTYTNSQTGWSSTLSVDTDGDGVADTILENLAAGVIQVAQPDGTTVDVEVVITPGGPEFTLDAGESLPITSAVFAPATALNGEVGALVITATNTVTGVAVSATNQSQVVSGKVRIDKVAALDRNCDGGADTPFLANQPANVEPNECVIWRIVAENKGAENAFNVQVRDAAPSFTTFEPGSLAYCINLNCTLGSVSETSGDDEGEENGGDVVFYIGAGATPAAQLGGELVSGDQATVQFSVRVD